MLVAVCAAFLVSLGGGGGGDSELVQWEHQKTLQPILKALNNKVARVATKEPGAVAQCEEQPRQVAFELDDLVALLRFRQTRTCCPRPIENGDSEGLGTYRTQS